MLLKLPMEFWDPDLLLGIASKAGTSMEMDDFTTKLQKMGFGRVTIEIDSSKPLKPRVLIRGKLGIFWQSFVYENIPSICHKCGLLGHVLEDCWLSQEEGQSGSHPMQSAKFYIDPMSVEGGLVADVIGALVAMALEVLGQLRLGPWMATTCIRQPVPVRAPANP